MNRTQFYEWDESPKFFVCEPDTFVGHATHAYASEDMAREFAQFMGLPGFWRVKCLKGARP